VEILLLFVFESLNGRAASNILNGSFGDLAITGFCWKLGKLLNIRRKKE